MSRKLVKGPYQGFSYIANDKRIIRVGYSETEHTWFIAGRYPHTKTMSFALSHEAMNQVLKVIQQVAEIPGMKEELDSQQTLTWKQFKQKSPNKKVKS
jgi:hypothetical protein